MNAESAIDVQENEAAEIPTEPVLHEPLYWFPEYGVEASSEAEAKKQFRLRMKKGNKK